MDPLPFIDTHCILVSAPLERVWNAVYSSSHGARARPAPALFARLWRLDPPSGFAVVEETAPMHVTLHGRHRFSSYELAFEIESRPDGIMLSAHTHAIFHGVTGRAYRALVIGSGGHRIVVRGC